MKVINLGKSGIEVSEFCLGAMYFGSRTDKETSWKLLDQYIEAGGTFIDTANVYARWVPGFVGGESEVLLGKWICERKNRSQMFIASKVGFDYQNIKRGLRAKQIESECERSLKRLGVDTIDLYYAHVDDRNTPLEETMKAFNRLVEAGKVRLIGASNYLAWRLEEARWVSLTNNWAEYCCVQQRHTYVRPKPGANFDPQLAVNDDLLDYCRVQGMTLLAYSTLLSGAYSNRPDRNFTEQYIGLDTNSRITALKKVARDIGATANQVVLAWMRQSCPAVIPLVAGSTLEQMKENYSALTIDLSADQMVYLNEASA